MIVIYGIGWNKSKERSVHAAFKCPAYFNCTQMYKCIKVLKDTQTEPQLPSGNQMVRDPMVTSRIINCVQTENKHLRVPTMWYNNNGNILYSQGPFQKSMLQSVSQRQQKVIKSSGFQRKQIHAVYKTITVVHQYRVKTLVFLISITSCNDDWRYKYVSP